MILTQIAVAPVIDFIINGILGAFNFLNNIEFLGTTMLRFSLMILVIGTAIPILFTLTNFRLGGTREKQPTWEESYNKWKEGGFK